MLSAKDFEEGRRAWKEARMERASMCGPCYAGATPSMTPFWDQYFEKDIEPVGTVNCSRALRVGSVRQGLEVVLLAAPVNKSNLLLPAGTSITMTFTQGDEEEGVFEDVGPSICVKAPANGLEIHPGHVVCRFPLPDFAKPWLMVSLEFSGAVTGGQCDCALNLAAR